MIRLSALIGQQGIALGTAATTGSVKGVAIDHDRIVGVQVGDELIASGAVRSFEGDVLTYDETAAGFSGTVSASDPRGKRVLDMDGDEHGQVADLAIDAEGRIDTVILDNGDTVAGSRLRVIGSYAAILADTLPPPTGQPIEV